METTLQTEQPKTQEVVSSTKPEKTLEQTLKIQEKYKKGKDLYMLNILTRKVVLPFTSIGKNVRELLTEKLVNTLGGKCAVEGYIHPNPSSIRILNYSSGVIEGANIVFEVAFECLVCNPVENMTLRVKAVNVTKAGIRAVHSSAKVSPIDVFIARDHNYNNKKFGDVKVDDEIIVRVLGQRYEINDTKISVIAELKSILREKPREFETQRKPSIQILDDE